jgi:ABC transporter substrate binding protein (PQQ-dependent alcohol dehydrogenase system)
MIADGASVGAWRSGGLATVRSKRSGQARRARVTHGETVGVAPIARVAAVVAVAVVVSLLGGAPTAAVAQVRDVVIGYLEWDDDPRYDPDRMEHGFPLHPAARPLPGARLGLDEAAFALQARGLKAALDAVEVADLDAARSKLDDWTAAGVPAVIVDLPADWVIALARHGEAQGARAPLLFNATAIDDGLRGGDCHPRVFHVTPNQRMRADAIAQMLGARRWSRVLVLQGPAPADQEMGKAYTASLRKFGLKTVATRPFKLSNDPRERDLGNVALLTANADYDAVLVIDADGEFAREVPFRTVLPRPVVGSDGVVAQAWHPRFERFGAPQLSRRFVKANGRPMSDWDWSTWMAAKAIAQALVESDDRSAAGLREALRSDKTILDGFKGSRLGFRPWDQQLRQPVFLGYGSGIAGMAPFEGFLHQKDVLDTLGFDQPESACRVLAK